MNAISCNVASCSRTYSYLNYTKEFKCCKLLSRDSDPARRLGGALDARAPSPDPFTEEVRASRQKDSEGCVGTPKYVPDIWLSCLLPANVEKCVFVTVTLDGSGSGKR